MYDTNLVLPRRPEPGLWLDSAILGNPCSPLRDQLRPVPPHVRACSSGRLNKEYLPAANIRCSRSQVSVLDQAKLKQPCRTLWWTHSSRAFTLKRCYAVSYGIALLCPYQRYQPATVWRQLRLLQGVGDAVDALQL